MAAIFGGKIFIFVVYLGVISLKGPIFILIIFISVWSSNNYVVNLMWIERYLEVHIEFIAVLLVH